MKTGLQFIEQIRTLRIKSPSPTQDQLLTFDQRSANAGGGWIAAQFEKLIAAVEGSFHREHTSDDRHSTITATGTITERNRDLPMGEWIPISLAAARFTGGGAMTWTVPVTFANAGMAYMFIGTTMFIRWNLVSTTVGGVVNPVLLVTIDSLFTPTGFDSSTSFVYNDNGTPGTGLAQIYRGTPGSGTVLYLYKDSSGATNWTAAAGTTHVQGQISCEILET